VSTETFQNEIYAQVLLVKTDITDVSAMDYFVLIA